MNIMNHFKTTRTLKRMVLAVGLLTALSGTSAFADTVWDPTLNATAASGFSSLETTSGALLAYLMGTTTGGNGLVETISSINDKLAHNNATGDQNWANTDTNSRRLTADQMMTQRRLDRIPDAAGCAETAYAGGRGAAAGGSAAVKSTVQQTTMGQMTGTHDQLGSMAKIVMARSSAGFCLSTDVASGRGGCGGVGTMPGGDINTSSLTQGAAAANVPTNQSLTTQQQTAAQAVINNIVTPLPPETLTPATEKTIKGGKYLAMMYVMAARASAAADALSSIASVRYANPALATSSSVNAATGQFGQTWQSSEVQTLYAKLFPLQQFPNQPSEWEMLRYDIFSRYADASGADSWQAKSASFTTEEALREIARMNALQLRLSELQIERQEEGNKMLAAMLSQSLQPVNRDSLHDAYVSASSSSNTPSQ